jgi:hypothetical protein
MRWNNSLDKNPRVIIAPRGFLIQSKLILDELKETEAVRTLLELTEEYNDVLLDGEPAMLITEMARCIRKGML